MLRGLHSSHVEMEPTQRHTHTQWERERERQRDIDSGRDGDTEAQCSSLAVKQCCEHGVCDVTTAELFRGSLLHRGRGEGKRKRRIQEEEGGE